MTVVLRKNFYTIYTFLVQRLECHFCRYPLYQITSFRKKVSLATRVSARYGGIISFICYSLYDTYLLRIKRTDSIVQKGESGIGMDTVIFRIQLFIYINVTVSNAGLYRIFFLPDNAVLLIKHFNKLGIVHQHWCNRQKAPIPQSP